MTITENKQLVYNFYKGFNPQNIDNSFNKFVSPDLKVYAFGKTLSEKEWKDMDKNVFLAFSDFKITVIDQIAEGDKVVTRATITGIHTGEFQGRSASGNHVKVNVIAIDRIYNGKIIEHWAELDFSSFLQQLVKKEKDKVTS
jgi:predicted ester cyclase